MNTDGVRTVRNSSPDSPEGDLGGSELTMTVKTSGFHTVRNSSLDSLDCDLGRVRAHFGRGNRLFSYK